MMMCPPLDFESNSIFSKLFANAPLNPSDDALRKGFVYRM